MNFPVKYMSLANNVFVNGKYSLLPIRYEDRLIILKWRNEQIYHLRQQQCLKIEAQEKYFNKTVFNLFSQKQPGQLLFSYLENGKCIGYGGLVHINWRDKNAEISFIMDTKLEDEYFEFHWSSYLSLIEKIAFKELKLHKIFTYAFDLRPQLYKVVEKCGYTMESILKEHFFYKGTYKDVVIHSKWEYS